MCERDQERKPLCLHPFCVLCPTPKNIDIAQPMTALDCMKETELSKYVCCREHLSGRHSVLTTHFHTATCTCSAPSGTVNFSSAPPP
jgi:hypothetical protein